MVTRSGKPNGRRYGPATFTASLLNTLAVGLATWYFLPWLALAVFIMPILLLDLAIGAVLATRAGNVGEVGRGMLIGLLAAPLTLLFFLPGRLLVEAVDLV